MNSWFAQKCILDLFNFWQAYKFISLIWFRNTKTFFISGTVYFRLSHWASVKVPPLKLTSIAKTFGLSSISQSIFCSSYEPSKSGVQPYFVADVNFPAASELIVAILVQLLSWWRFRIWFRIYETTGKYVILVNYFFESDFIPAAIISMIQWVLMLVFGLVEYDD